MIHRLIGTGRGLGIVVAPFVLAGVSMAQCVPGFVAHHIPSLGGKVYATTLFDDDGDGIPSIFAGGDTFTYEGVSLGGVAKLEGNRWIKPGTGFAGNVRAMLVRVEAGVPRLIAAGGAIRSWDGQQWTQVGNSTPGFIQSMALHNDGGGETLYVGGMMQFVYRLVGSAWAPTSTTAPLNASRVQSLVEFDADGPGGLPPRLYAAGSSLFAGGQACLVAKWDGLGWSPVTPVGQSNWLKAMIRHDDGTGPKLYATAHGSGAAQPFAFNVHVASFDGTQWRSIVTPPNMPGPLYALASFQERIGQPRVLWGITDTQLLRSPDNGATVFANGAGITAPDYSQITPLILPAIGAGPECLIYQDAAFRFRKLAGCPRLAADITLDGVLGVNDIFEYLGFWFEGDPLADFDHSGGLAVNDIFAFLSAWFAGI